MGNGASRDIFEIDNTDVGNIKNTDIFTWGLFLENTKKTIYINKMNQYIEKCKFKKGLLNLTAKIIK